MPSSPLSPLPSLSDQLARIVALGLPERCGVEVAELERAAADDPGDALLVIHPTLARPSLLAPLLSLDDRPGFVVEDMVDVDDFAPIEQARPPAAPVQLLVGPERGDEFADRSPDEVLPELLAAGRTPLLLSEGIQWALQVPEVLERNHCFMTIGSRLVRAGRADRRTPALWISNGTGRDGRERRGAPKVGWCWAGNRHTWLGVASAQDRTALAARQG